MRPRVHHRAMLWLLAAALTIGFGTSSPAAANACCGQGAGCPEVAQHCEWTAASAGCCKEPLSLTASYADPKPAAKGALVPASSSLGTTGTTPGQALPRRFAQPLHRATLVLRL